MSVKFLNIQLSSVALAFAIVMVGISGFGTAGPAQASTSSSVDCLKPLSLQEQATCNKEKQATESGPGAAVAWLFPPADDRVTEKSQLDVKVKGEGALVESGRRADSPSSTGLLLFAVALVGIMYLGRRRRKIPIQGK
ncbi:MAG: hypothetical protein WDZ54_01780 [Sneathiella sp.]